MLNSIENKKILIVIGGGIAAYKVLDVIRELRKNNCEVKTILTNSGKEFVTPLSISALSKNKVFENLFDPNKLLRILFFFSRPLLIVVLLVSLLSMDSHLSQQIADLHHIRK